MSGGADDIASLLAAFKATHDVDKRIAALKGISTSLQSDATLEHADQIDAAFGLALRNANAALYSAALQQLPHYTRFIVNNHRAHQHQHQQNAQIRRHIASLLPLLLERSADAKEKNRSAASHATQELGKMAMAFSSSPVLMGKAKEGETPVAVFERTLRDVGLMAKNPRVREQSIGILVGLRQAEASLHIRPFLHVLVELLSDADAGVRDAARRGVIIIFSGASAAAKADLKREMERLGVRRQTMESVLAGLASEAVEGATLGQPPPCTDIQGADPPVGPRHAAVDVKAPPEADRKDEVVPMQLFSQGELERHFASMRVHFDGKETEHNWAARERSILQMRGMLRGSVHVTFPNAFANAIKGVADGIVKTVRSLRTTLAMQGITLVGELVEAMEDHLDPVVDLFFTTLLAMAGFTKKIVANASQSAVRLMLTRLSFRHRFLENITAGLGEKNASTRLHMCEHLLALFDAHLPAHRTQFESHAGLGLIEAGLRRIFADANKDVRARARECFARFREVWPDEGERILLSIDVATRKQLLASSASASSSLPSQSRQTSKAQGDVGPPFRSKQAGPSAALLAAKKSAAERMTQSRTIASSSSSDVGQGAKEKCTTPPISNGEEQPSSSGKTSSPIPADVQGSSETPLEGGLVFQAGPDVTRPGSATAPPPGSGSEDEWPDSDRQEEPFRPAVEPVDTASARPTDSPRQPSPPYPESRTENQATPATQWFLRTATRFEGSEVPSGRRPHSAEMEDLLKILSAGEADMKTLRKLSKCSAAFPIPTEPLAATPAELDEAKAAWLESSTFQRVWDGLCRFLEDADTNKELRLACWVVLQRLIENQFALVEELGLEERLLDVVIVNAHRRRSRSAWSAREAALFAWCSRTAPLLGLHRLTGALRSAMATTHAEQTPADVEARVQTLVLKALAKVLPRLPAELVEDELSHSRDLVKRAFNDGDVDLRQAAVGVLVACHSTLRDERALFELLAPLEKAQMDLLSYYFAKAM